MEKSVAHDSGNLESIEGTCGSPKKAKVNREIVTKKIVLSDSSTGRHVCVTPS